MWSKEFFLEFLEIYQKNDCLWRIKSKDYYNKRKKKEGYEKLLAKARCVDPNFTEIDVKKKINNFRSSFRKEYKKATNAIITGNNDDVYVPKLWYYDYLLFLKDQEEPIEGDSEPENSEAELTEESSTSVMSSNSYKRQRTSSHEFQEQGLSGQSDEMNMFGSDYLSPSVHYEDSFDITGRNIASKLRQLKTDQYTIAEKLINDVIYEGQFNNLNKDTRIVIPLTEPEVAVPSTDNE